MDAQYVVLIRLQGVATHWGHEGLQQLQIWEKESSSQHKLGELQPGWVHKSERATALASIHPPIQPTVILNKENHILYFQPHVLICFYVHVH